MHDEPPAPPPPKTDPPPPFPWITCFLLGTTLGVFLLQLLDVRLHGDDAIGRSLAFTPEAWARHRDWTLVTYAWVHAVAPFGQPLLFWLHITTNLIPLICLGPPLEELLGRRRFLGLYLGGAASAALVWLFFNPRSASDQGIIGASGAIFALIAAAGTAAPRVRVLAFFFFVLPVPMSLWVLVAIACGGEVLQILFHWTPQVAHSAHLGGAAFGFLYVLAIRLGSRTWKSLD